MGLLKFVSVGGLDEMEKWPKTASVVLSVAQDGFVKGKGQI